MNPLKKAFFTAAKKLDINFLKKTSGLNLLIPFHHLVSDEYVPFISPLYGFKSKKQFEEDLDYFLKHFKPVSLKEVVAQAKRGVPFKEKSFLITFDDALRNVYDEAMPILLKKGVPAAVFVSPPFVENKVLFYDFKKGLIIDELLKNPPTVAVLKEIAAITLIDQITVPKLIDYIKSINYLHKDQPGQIGSLLQMDFDAFQEKERPFMSVEQVKAFVKAGFEAGAHSMSHPRYSLIPVEEQLKETRNSLKWVDKTLQLPYKVFAFPHVDTGVNKTFFDNLFAGADGTPPDLIFGNRTAMLEHDPQIIHRFIGENPLISAEAMCKAVLLFNIINQARGKQYVNRN